MLNDIKTYIKNEDKYILFIYFFLFVMPWNFFKWQMGAFTTILFIWWLLKYKKELKEKLKTLLDFKPLVILIIFIIYTYITPLWSESWIEGFNYVNDFHKYYIFLILILFTSFNSEQAQIGIRLFIISFMLYSIFSILIYLGLFTIEDTNSTSSNPKGIMGYAIVTQYMAIGSISSFFIALFSKDKKVKLIFFLFSFLCLFALSVNNSRTAQLAFILSTLTLFVFYYKQSIFKLRNMLFMFLAIAIVSSLTVAILEYNNKLDRYKIAFNEAKGVIYDNKYEGSFGLRLYFNKVGLEIIRENLFFGTGPVDNTKQLEDTMKNDPDYTVNYTFSAFHSNHIDLLTRYGIVGYLLLISSLIYLFFIYKDRDSYFYTGLSFYVVIFFISFANATFSKKPINYIFISIFVLLSIIAYQKYKEKISNANS